MARKKYPPRLRRSDSFLGIHFDLHATEKCTQIWRDVTAKNGVALFMHYSGVLDREAVVRHPSWASIGPDGARHHNATSVFGPYVDKLLIPQLKELSDVYGVDGGNLLVVGPKAAAMFRKELRVRYVGQAEEKLQYLEHDGFLTGLKTLTQRVKLGAGAPDAFCGERLARPVRVPCLLQSLHRRARGGVHARCSARQRGGSVDRRPTVNHSTHFNQN